MRFAFVICIYALRPELNNTLSDFDSFHVSISPVIVPLSFFFSRECPTRSTRTIFLNFIFFCFCFEASPVAIGGRMKKIIGILDLLNTLCLFILSTVSIHSGHTNEQVDKSKKTLLHRAYSPFGVGIWGRA